MAIKLASVTNAAAAATSTAPIAAEEEYYSSWSLFLVCMLLMLSLLTSYYLQIKRIRAVHETLVSIFAGMFVGLIVRVAPGQMIREMLVSANPLCGRLRASVGAAWVHASLPSASRPRWVAHAWSASSITV